MRTFVLVTTAVLALTGLTGCMGGDGDDRRAGALVSVSGTGGRPFHGGSPTLTRPITNGSWSGSDSFTVPAKKLLVIEQLSVFLTLPSGQEPFWSSLETTVGGVTNRHRLRRFEAYPYANYFILSQDLTLYADPGTSVTLEVSRAPAQNLQATFIWSVSGYLVDA